MALIMSCTLDICLVHRCTTPSMLFLLLECAPHLLILVKSSSLGFQLIMPFLRQAFLDPHPYPSYTLCYQFLQYHIPLLQST